MRAWFTAFVLPLLCWIWVFGFSMSGIGYGLVNAVPGQTVEQANFDVLPPGNIHTPPISSKLIAQILGANITI
jgi:hypothetical protein